MILRITLWIVLAVLTHSLLYEQPLGLNILITTVLGALALFQLKKFEIKYPIGFIVLLAVAVPSLYNAHFIGLLLAVVALITLVGLETEQVQQSFFGFLAGVSKLLKAPFASKGFSLQLGQKGWRIKWAYVFIPLLVSLVFIGFYANSIPVFGDALNSIFSDLGDLITRFFSSFSITAILFFAFMLFCTAFLIFPNPAPGIGELEKATPLEIRKKAHRLSFLGDVMEGARLIPKKGLLSLKHEFKISVLIVVSLNVIIFLALLAGVYGIVHPELLEGAPSYQLVHEGTFNLIVSLLVGAGLVIYFFRGNLNFFQKSGPLKKLSILWLVQNLLMAVLDAVYNFEYIVGYGLTYKRIGVYFFLFLTVVGLVVVFFKVQKQFSTFKTLKLGLYVALGFAAVVSPINWDAVIVSHNLRKGVERSSLLPYTVDLSYRSLPELIEQKEFYARYIGPEHGYYTDVIDRKIAHYQVHCKGAFGSKTYLKLQVDQAIKEYQNQR